MNPVLVEPPCNFFSWGIFVGRRIGLTVEFRRDRISHAFRWQQALQVNESIVVINKSRTRIDGRLGAALSLLSRSALSTHPREFHRQNRWK